MEVIVVVDWEEVSVDVSVPKLHVHARYAMDGLEENVELQKTSGAVSPQAEAAIFGLKLETQETQLHQCTSTPSTQASRHLR